MAFKLLIMISFTTIMLRGQSLHKQSMMYVHCIQRGTFNA
jgi:hypothetical protein